MRLTSYDIRYERAVTRWDEGLPLGNGKLGCLIYGDGPIRFSLDRVDLWDQRPNPTTLEEGFTYANMVRLVKDGSPEAWVEQKRLFDDIFTATPYPSKITAGRLELRFENPSAEISSRLELSTAIARLKVGENSIEAFTSATRFVGVARIVGEYGLALHIPAYITGELGYPTAKPVRDGEFFYYEQKTHTDFTYGIVAMRKDFGSYGELYFTIGTGEGFLEKAKRELKEAYALGYVRLRREHTAWWRKYWRRSEISVGDELLERTYYRSWYLFASCSREGFYPMPLQGVWTADDDNLPPWKGDYHHDTNTELSYQAYLKANRLDEGRVFVDYLWRLKDTYRAFAKSFFGVDGILLPSCSTLEGGAMGGWGQYALSPTMTIWAAQSFDEYYLYTGDEAFLRERAYPFLQGVGEAIAGLLEERNGKLYLPLSTSPEIFDNTREAFLEPNSNFDLALMRYLYKTLAGYAAVLGEDGGRYEAILGKLDEIAVLNGKFPMLDKTRKLEVSHRHFSHLMALYPLHLISYDTPEHRKLYDGAIFELERLGTGNWVGFSFAMCAQIYAMAKKGNGAYEKLRAFAKGFVADNGFHLNGDFKDYGFSTFHYRPFTLESSFGFCDALQEMLLQEHEGRVEPFPAIPDEWKTRKLSFTRLRSYGGVLVSATAEGGRVTALTLESEKPVGVRVKNAFGETRLRLSDGSTVECATDGEFALTVNGSVTVSL